MAGETSPEIYENLELPSTFKAITVHKDEENMFDGVPTKEKDPRKSLHLDDVPLPELAPGEALVAVMASAINYIQFGLRSSSQFPRSASLSVTANFPNTPSATIFRTTLWARTSPALCCAPDLASTLGSPETKLWPTAFRLNSKAQTATTTP